VSAAVSQEAARGGDGVPATLAKARRALAGLLGQASGDSAAAHLLAARVEQLGSSRRKEERTREHLEQVVCCRPGSSTAETRSLQAPTTVQRSG